uniref:AarF domain containing kinase 5 n=1 Tax=Accipiter nisus TaxID=211598 RepID=A0A8B9MRL1_9AVES
MVGTRGPRAQWGQGPGTKDYRDGGDKGQGQQGWWGQGTKGRGAAGTVGTRGRGWWGQGQRGAGDSGLQGRWGPGQEQGPARVPPPGRRADVPPVPRPQRVLTADFCEGCKITNVEGIRSQGLGVQDAADKLIRVFAEQIFYTGFIHADPHPGNVLVRRGPDGKAQLVLLDHGLYEFLSERDRSALCQLWRAIVLRDDAAMKLRSAELGVEDYFLFCEILMQRPLQPGQLALANVLTREERAYMQEMASQHFQRILGVLRALPRPMLLVFRNINTVRSINAALGAPVDRYFLMAKSAVRSWSRLSGEKSSGIRGSSLFCWLRVAWESLKFEVALRLESISMKLMASTLRLLASWGLLPHSQEIYEYLRA